MDFKCYLGFKAIDGICSINLRIMKIVEDAGYTGFLGVEFEGNTISEEKGIELTRNLLLKIDREFYE